MNRHKNQARSVENSDLMVPIEAAQDVRILPGASDLTRYKNNNAIISALEPFLHMLPNMVGVDMEVQKNLYKQLYAAGVNAAFSMHKFICENNTMRANISALEQNNSDWKAVKFLI